MIVRCGNASDISGILSLQERNLYSNLSETERKNGFVTTPFTFDQIEDLLGEKGVFVATRDNGVVGYAMAGSWDYFSQWPIFPHMVARLSSLRFMEIPIDAKTSFQYGPVCIDIKYRGATMLSQLFEKLRIEFSGRYPVGVTFINRLNQRSYAAHTKKLGMQIVDQFEFNDRQYYGLAFSTQVPVSI